MPRSQFIEAERLKPLIGFLAVAFMVVLAVGTVVPRGGVRTALIAGWVVAFPLGIWKVLKRPSP